VPVRSVLVVDDTPAIRKLVCDIFASEEDIEVSGQAENGREAIEKAQLLRPDLIVMDLYMPLMNGFEATRALKRLMPAVPVIIFSAHLDAFMEKEAQRAGAAAIVSKSDPVAVLVRKTRELLGQIAA
jgi:DNA-binding NarL/FixJ family response regulator